MRMRKKLIPTLQIAQTECGLCCVRTILEYYGFDISITELRQIEEPGRDGLSTKQLKKLLQKFNLTSNAYKINNPNAFKVIDFPVIAFWKGYHFVCIEKIENNHAFIMDPSIGRVKIDLKDFFENFSEIIIASYPNETFRKRKKSFAKRYNYRKLIPSDILNNYLGLIITSVLVIAINISIPVLTQLLIDSVQTNNYDFRYIILSIVFLGIVSGTVFYFKSVLSITLMKNFSWHLLSTAFNRILSLPSKYFTVRSPGEIVYRLNSLTRIQDLFGTSLIQLFLDIISLFAILIYLSGVSIILTGVELLFILLLFTLLINLQPKIQSTSDNELHQASLAQSIQLDAIVSINNIKLGGYKEAYKEDWASKYKKSLDYTAERMNIQQSWIGTILGMVSAFVPLVILSMALFQFSLGRLSLGEAVATQTVTSLLYNYANSIFTTFSNFSVLNRYVDLAEDIYEYPIENSGDIKYQIFKDKLVLDNVSFSYSGNNIYALRSINLKIKKGETIALVGESGSGKSTLGKIISSLFMPTIGTIYLDGISYKDYELDSFRNRIGYIPQESYLHNRSIIDNIALGCETERDEIIKKCKNIPFLDFINNLPMGYNTQISEMGGNLSGGQRQRIKIAKILIKQPELLIMDEATSSLDNVSQKYVYDELNVMNCTKIIIAHRLETILNADKIIVLESGKISQVGTHDQLITEAGGLYSKLFTAENLENKK